MEEALKIQGEMVGWLGKDLNLIWETYSSSFEERKARFQVRRLR